MRVAIMQPYLFPYIGYWQLIQASDIFVIYDDVNYINRGWVNRNAILEQGSRKLFTLELQGASQNKLINQINVGGNRAKIIKTLSQNYKKSPYFEPVINVLSEIMTYEEENLARFLENSIRRICSYIDIRTKIIVSSNEFSNKDLKREYRLMDICKSIGGDIYINPIGGKNLYNRVIFADNNIQLLFLESNPIMYSQFGNNSFIPNLSIVDIMMFNLRERIKEFVNEFSLI